MVATSPIAVVAEDLRYDSADVEHLFRFDEHIQLLREVRLRAEPASYPHLETDFPLPVHEAAHRLNAQVVDLGLIAVDRAAGDRDFIFAGQIGEVLVAHEKLRHLFHDRTRIVDLFRIDARDRAAADVARNVAAGARRREARRVQFGDDRREHIDGKPVVLEVLARGDVGNVFASLFRHFRHRAQLHRRHAAAGNAHPHHEVAFVRLLLVDSIPAHSDKIFGIDAGETLCRIAQNIGPYVQSVLRLLNRLYIGFRHDRLAPSRSLLAQCVCYIVPANTVV